MEGKGIVGSVLLGAGFWSFIFAVMFHSPALVVLSVVLMGMGMRVLLGGPEDHDG